MLSELIALHQLNLNNERTQPRGDKNIGGQDIYINFLGGQSLLMILERDLRFKSCRPCVDTCA